MDQISSGNFFRGKIYDWLKKGILLMWIIFLHFRPEVLRGASCAKTHFVHCLGGSRLVNIRSNATLLQPRVCLLSEIVNRGRSKFCYISVFTWAMVKIHGKDRRKPKLSVNAISSWVSILDSLSADCVNDDSWWFFLGSSGITLICAPVSTKNKYPVFLSRM